MSPVSDPALMATAFLESAVRRFWRDAGREGCFTGWRRIVVGVSGGADSMALLWLVTSKHGRPPDAPAIVAGHVHHGLRGADSDRDEASARDLAVRLKVPFRVRRLNGEELREGAGLEERARIARLAALRDIVGRSGADGVALAHHADDLAETLLMRLLRGSGLTGLAGFRALENLDGLAIARPLIDWNRDGLREVLHLAGIEWREDASNTDRAFLRNRIRHDLIPALDAASDHGPVTPMLARTARRLAREGAAISVWSTRLYGLHRMERPEPPRRLGLAAEAFVGDAGLFASHLLRPLVMEAADSAYPPEQEHILELEGFAREAKPDALLQGPWNLSAWKSWSGAVWLLKKPRRSMSRDELLEMFHRP